MSLRTVCESFTNNEIVGRNMSDDIVPKLDTAENCDERNGLRVAVFADSIL